MIDWFIVNFINICVRVCAHFRFGLTDESHISTRSTSGGFVDLDYSNTDYSELMFFSFIAVQLTNPVASCACSKSFVGQWNLRGRAGREALVAVKLFHLTARSLWYLGWRLHILPHQHFWRNCFPAKWLGGCAGRHCRLVCHHFLLRGYWPCFRAVCHRNCWEVSHWEWRSVFFNRSYDGLTSRRIHWTFVLLRTSSRLCLKCKLSIQTYRLQVNVEKWKFEGEKFLLGFCSLRFLENRKILTQT